MFTKKPKSKRILILSDNCIKSIPVDDFSYASDVVYEEVNSDGVSSYNLYLRIGTEVFGKFILGAKDAKTLFGNFRESYCSDTNTLTLDFRSEGMPQYYRHVKSGGIYELIGKNEITFEADLSPLTVYRSVKTNVVWARPTAEFFDGRFELLSDDDFMAETL